MNKIDCRPFWVNFSKHTNATCSRGKLRKYLVEMLKATNMDQKSLFHYYGCQRPCEYYEFKVDHSLNFDS